MNVDGTATELISLGWTLDIWDESRGLRIQRDAECGSMEFGLLFTRAEATDNGIISHVTHGDSSAHVNVKKLDPECEVYLFGGLIEPDRLLAWLQKAIALLS